ncbi:hypothetical protein BDW02DRAFT_81851 [Decorospora gaudefroyi]|uniref:Uncharacterized protein n=1 Tax=Decorospora gaudefroyi TaxID=184978 RepID=A0A6A5KSF6_9PLEO|nr:hypothetical protein BDW02DRAFT_81851 [Decorospora gaudefroyi]
MPVNEANVATAALAIAISALVIALGQLIAQLFSTAEGYRRCQASVIGSWFDLVELPFRWSSFRFEVKVTTPHFQIETISSPTPKLSFFKRAQHQHTGFPRSLFQNQTARLLIPAHHPVPLIGDSKSRKGTFCRPLPGPDDGEDDDDTEGVNATRPTSLDYAEDAPTWINLLEDMHKLQHAPLASAAGIIEGDTRAAVWSRTLVCISRKTRSWDFMPPDIVRPVASTTLGCLIVMTHRMGMVWTDFRPEEGVVRAASKTQSFSTSLVRGMGLVVEYATIGSSPLRWRVVSFPCRNW